MFKVTVIFDRKNPKTGKIEQKMERWGTLGAESPEEAKRIYLDQFTINEPTRRRIHKVSVTPA